jgi:drug/metabolite transporter (DMT)-like permease
MLWINLFLDGSKMQAPDHNQYHSKKLRAYLALGGGVLALGFSPLFVRWAEAPGMVTSFYRMLIASALLILVVIRHGKVHGWPKIRALAFAALAGVFTSLDIGFWSMAVDHTSIANAQLLNNISPLWVAFFAMAVWHERLKPLFWIALAAVLIGAATVLGGTFSISAEFALGDVLAVISSFFYAGYFITTQKGRGALDSLTFLWTTSVVASVCLLTASQALRMPLFGYPRSNYLIFLAAALFDQMAGYLLIVYALGNLPASVVTPTMVLQPVLSILLAIPFAGENLMPYQVLGGIVTLAGVYLVNISHGGK